MPAYPENETLVTPNATTSLLSTGMLDREKQAKKQQDTEYEGAGGRANTQLKSYRLQYKALNHALASDIDCIYSRRLRQILRSTKKHRGGLKEGKTKSAPMTLVLVKGDLIKENIRDIKAYGNLVLSCRI